MPRSREFSIDPQSEDRTQETLDQHGKAVYNVTPQTDMQALMEAAPGEAVRTSKESRLPLRDTLADAIDGLPPQERWAFERLIIERLPIREVARMMGTTKSTVHRYKEQAIARLKAELSPLLKEWLDE